MDPKYIYELPIDVRDYELDVQGIVNNAHYLHYLEMTRHEFCREAGLSFAEMHRRGIDPVVKRIDIEYISPLVSGDRVASRLNMRREGARFVFRQDLFKLPGEEPVIRAEVTIVCTEGGRLTRGEALLKAFAHYLE